MVTALVEVAELSGWPVGQIYVRGFNQQRPEPTGWWTPGAAPYERFRTATEASGFVEGEGLPGRVTIQGRPSLIADVAADEDFPRGEVAAGEGLVGGSRSRCSPDKGSSPCSSSTPRPGLPDRQLLELMADIGIQLGRVFERLRWQHHELQSALGTKKHLRSMLAPRYAPLRW